MNLILEKVTVFSIILTDSQSYIFKKLVGCRHKIKYPLMGPGLTGGMPSVGGGLSKGLWSVFNRVSEITTENSEQLGRQARPGFELGTSVYQFEHITTQPLVGALRNCVKIQFE